MRHLALLSFIFLLGTSYANAQDGKKIEKPQGKLTLLEGTFKGGNLIIKNVYSPSDYTFCITGIIINDTIAHKDIKTTGIEINFRNYGIKKDDPLIIEIYHGEKCEFKVTNPHIVTGEKKEKDEKEKGKKK